MKLFEETLTDRGSEACVVRSAVHEFLAAKRIRMCMRKMSVAHKTKSRLSFGVVVAAAAAANTDTAMYEVQADLYTHTKTIGRRSERAKQRNKAHKTIFIY